MERAEIAELLYDTLVSCGDVEQLIGSFRLGLSGSFGS